MWTETVFSYFTQRYTCS